jgi:hypothetical protein
MCLAISHDGGKRLMEARLDSPTWDVLRPSSSAVTVSPRGHRWCMTEEARQGSSVLPVKKEKVEGEDCTGTSTGDPQGARLIAEDHVAPRNLHEPNKS